MEKIPPKLALRKEKVQSSCIWRLVDIFDFSGGRSNQKLITNGRRTAQKDISDVAHSKKVHKIASCSEKSHGFEGGASLAMDDVDAFQEHIKNLMKEEFDTQKKLKKQKKATKKQLKSSDFELLDQLQDDYKKPTKPSKKADQVHIQQWKDKFLLGPGQSSSCAEPSLDEQNFETMCEEICSQIYQERILGADLQKVISPKPNELDQVNLQLLQITAKAFSDQIFINRKHNYKDGMSSKSQYFSDASEILDLNRDLFLKLLQDPNSLLLRNIQNLPFPLREKERMKLYLDPKPYECGSSSRRNNGHPEDAMKIQKKNSNYPLWKKFKDQYGCSSKGNTTSRASNRIVILKPRSKSKQNPENVSCHCSSLHAHQSSKNKGQNIKSTYFSFKDIKRKFKQAVGENKQKQHWISMDESLRRLARKKHLLKDVDKGNSSGSGKGKSVLSPDSKEEEEQLKLVDLPSSNRIITAHSGGTIDKSFNSSISSCSKQRQLDIFMEAKRHLSERLRNVDMGEIVPRKVASKTLKMILSSPEDFMTTHITKRDKSDSVSAQMRFSPYNNIQMSNANSLQNEKGKEADLRSPHTEEVPSCDFRSTDDQLELSEFTAKISKKLHTDPEVLEDINSIKDDLESSGSANILEGNEVVLPRSLNSVDDASTKKGTTVMYEEHGYMESSDLTIPSQNHPLRPSFGSPRSLNIQELEIAGTAKYREEHASPVSVLEPFSPEDVRSPTSITSRPDESSLQPRHIDFDDYSQVVSREDPKISTNVEESLHLYVRAVMEASELSFNEIHLKGPSPQDVLYTCMADRIGIHLVESYTELQLLFDCIHEVLLGIYASYSGCSPWLSFLRQKIRPLPLEKDVVNEVVEEVNSYLHPMLGQPTLDQLVGKDIAKPGSWPDLCLDTEDILIQIAEDVLQDSIEDTILEAQI